MSDHPTITMDVKWTPAAEDIFDTLYVADISRGERDVSYSVGYGRWLGVDWWESSSLVRVKVAGITCHEDKGGEKTVNLTLTPTGATTTLRAEWWRRYVSKMLTRLHSWKH
jgi:hypothetical protein